MDMISPAFYIRPPCGRSQKSFNEGTPVHRSGAFSRRGIGSRLSLNRICEYENEHSMSQVAPFWCKFVLDSRRFEATSVGSQADSVAVAAAGITYKKSTSRFWRKNAG